MTELTSKHFNDILAENPTASFGFVQAAKAVYASRYGIYNTSDGSTPRFRNIALKLSEKYGDMLTAAELRFEMKVAHVIHN